MSYPANPLASYRSYSYYHVLAICNSSETAYELSKITSTDVWAHATDNGILGPYSPKKLSVDASKQDMEYCILINGSSDASYVITKASWNSSTAAGATPNDRYTSVAVEGSITISEPKGIMFLDQTIQCCKALGVDSASATFVLKTFFIGYGYEPSVGEFVDVLSDIPPLQFVATLVTGAFTEAGGEYVMNFAAMSGGATRFPQYSTSAAAINMKAEQTLSGTFKKLSEKINESYNTYYSCVTAQVSHALQEAKRDPKPVLEALQRVTYNVTWDPIYDQPEYTVSDQPQQAKTVPGCGTPATLSFPPQMSIEDMIHRIMAMSPRVQRDLAEGRGVPALKYEYRIHALLSSTPTSITVTYHVEPFLRPKDIMTSFEPYSDFTNNSASDPKYNPQFKNCIIEFDYLYTGKNTDILEFDMTLNLGLAYLQTATISNTYKSSFDNAPSQTRVVSAADQTTLTRLGELTPVPVFFGSQIQSNWFKNSQNAPVSTQSAYTMSKHSSLEVQAAVMKITGNPLLLGGVNQYSSPDYHFDRLNAHTETEQLFDQYGSSPMFAQVHIKMPRNNDDLSLLTGQLSDQELTGGTNADYAQEFWFDGYYYIHGVTTSFENGLFTQTLNMLGIPRKGIIEETKDGQQSELNLTNSVPECYNSMLGQSQPQRPGTTGGATVSPPKVVDGKPASAVDPTNKSDADQTVKNIANVNDVTGWDNAPVIVKSAITQAAQATGVNIVTLASMARIESNFGRNTINPLSKARGLYQIIKSTWEGVVNSGRVPGVPRGTPWSEADNPQTNALVAATYMLQNNASLAPTLGVPAAQVSPGDTYLAHFAGPGGAQAIIKGDLSHGSNYPMLQAYIDKWKTDRGTNIFNSQQRANPQIIKPTSTVGEIRAWAAIKMTGTSPKGKIGVSGPPTPSPAISAPAAAPTKPTAADRANAALPPQSTSPTKKSCNETKPAKSIVTPTTKDASPTNITYNQVIGK